MQKQAGTVVFGSPSGTRVISSGAAPFAPDIRVHWDTIPDEHGIKYHPTHIPWRFRTPDAIAQIAFMYQREEGDVRYFHVSTDTLLRVWTTQLRTPNDEEVTDALTHGIPYTKNDGTPCFRQPSPETRLIQISIHTGPVTRELQKEAQRLNRVLDGPPQDHGYLVGQRIRPISTTTWIQSDDTIAYSIDVTLLGLPHRHCLRLANRARIELKKLAPSYRIAAPLMLDRKQADLWLAAGEKIFVHVQDLVPDTGKRMDRSKLPHRWAILSGRNGRIIAGSLADENGNTPSWENLVPQHSRWYEMELRNHLLGAMFPIWQRRR